MLGTGRTSAPCDVLSSTPRVRVPAVARLHAHLHGLVTPIHEISGLRVGNMLIDIVGTILFTVYFSVCFIFIVRRKNIFYPRYTGSLAVMQGTAGIIGGILWILVFLFLRK
jgi:hypothetical protein